MRQAPGGVGCLQGFHFQRKSIETLPGQKGHFHECCPSINKSIFSGVHDVTLTNTFQRFFKFWFQKGFDCFATTKAWVCFCWWFFDGFDHGISPWKTPPSWGICFSSFPSTEQSQIPGLQFERRLGPGLWLGGLGFPKNPRVAQGIIARAFSARRTPNIRYVHITSWWFQIFLIFTPNWGRFPFWLIFFKGVETTKQITPYSSKAGVFFRIP